MQAALETSLKSGCCVSSLVVLLSRTPGLAL